MLYHTVFVCFYVCAWFVMNVKCENSRFVMRVFCYSSLKSHVCHIPSNCIQLVTIYAGCQKSFTKHPICIPIVIGPHILLSA